MGRTSENPMPKGESDDQLAENFVDFFMEKIKKICDSLHDYDVYKPCFSESNKFSEFVPLSEQEEAAIIGKMASKSCEINPIPTTLLKKVLPSVIGPITAIVNCSITQGIFAQHLKMAIIRPLLKKAGLAPILSNFCPVSNLSFLSKVVECAVLKQFNEHSTRNNLIPDYQSAYRSNYSCETAVVKIVNDILWSMENQECTNYMAIDLLAAFDTVVHVILLDVLQKRFRIEGVALMV